MDKYTVSGRIGEGAHGVVLKAVDTTNGHEVALKKVLLKRIEDGIPTSIIREVKTLETLKHSYVSSTMLFKYIFKKFRFKYIGIRNLKFSIRKTQLLFLIKND